LSNRIPNELSIGDVIRSAKGTEQYLIDGFNGDNLVMFVLLKNTRTGKTIVRTTTQVMKNWRMVKSR
jgi:hypothetical protein